MPVLKKDLAKMQHVRDGVSRRLTHLNDLMMVVIDFTNGPWQEPEPLHHHVHEQVSYVAEGEVTFYCEGEEPQRLTRGDMFCVPSNKKHGIQLLSAKATLIDSFNPIREDFI